MKRLLVTVLLFAAPALADSRTWTDKSGKHSISAELAEFQNGVVYLKKDDGATITVPFVKLSEADQAFIKSTRDPVQVISGKVIAVPTGDVLTVKNSFAEYKVCLDGVAAPSGEQAFGAKAQDALSGKVLQQDVRVEWRHHDSQGHVLGNVFLGDRWINKETIDEGLAWHDHENSSVVLASAEGDSRKQKAGLWTDPNPTPPWEFGRKQRAPIASTAEDDPFSPVKASTPIAAEPKTAAPTIADRNPNGETPTGQTATGIPTFTGPKGGQYHYSANGNKVYSRKK